LTDEERFARLVREHGPALRRLAAAWERDAAAREDLLQEILFALWRALPRFRGEASERTFVLRVAHNRALTHRFRAPPRAAALESAAEVSDPAPSPEAVAVAEQRRQQLTAALRRLPVPLRQVLVLGLEGLSRAEMAEVLGITENNATVRLSRARRALQEELERP
jgi:RNA polymerase sigma factor (sigma-70 family)